MSHVEVHTWNASTPEELAKFDHDVLAALASDALNGARSNGWRAEHAIRRRRWAVARLVGVAVWGAAGWTAAGVCGFVALRALGWA